MREIVENKGPLYEFGGFVVDPGERVLLVNGKSVHLADKIFDTLLLLLRHNGHLLTKDEMLSRLWEDAYVEESNLSKNISRLRKILNSEGTEFIETLPKQGYRFVGEVKEIDARASMIVRREMRVKVTRHDEAPDQPELPTELTAVRRFQRTWLPLLAVTISSIAFLSIGSYFWFRNSHSDTTRSNRAGPTRLTTSEFREDGAMWMADDQIRFYRFSSNKIGESIVMSSDGTNQRDAGGEFKSLQSGIWSPDGSKVLFAKKNEDPYTLFVANSDGSREVKLPFRPGPITWSPDGKQLAYNAYVPSDSRDSDIFIYTLDTRKSVNISNNAAFDSNPSFSPDGKQIIFDSNREENVEIYMMNVDGSGVRRLTDHPAKEAFQAFSPDGTQILFNSNRENEHVGFYLMNVNDASPPVKISDTNYNEEIRPGCWSPDGTQVVFTSDRDGKTDNIYKMSVEPFKPTLVFADENSEIESQSLSPDGTQMVFEAKMADGSGELRVLDVEKAAVRTILRTENIHLRPAWSPVDDTVAFSSRIDGNLEICTIRPDGTQLRNLTQNPARDGEPSWSPEGNELVFTSDRDGKSEEVHLFVMNSDGSGQRRLTQKGGYEFSPEWSADGKSILFAGDRVDGKARGLDIFSVETQNPANEKILFGGRAHDSSPSMSPDGSRIVFQSHGDGNDEIYMINSDGSGLLRLTRNRAIDASPQFSRDGKRVLFSSNRTGKFAIFEITIP